MWCTCSLPLVFLGMSIQEFQGSIATFSWCIAFVLIVVSGTMCKHFRYRTLFISFQVIQALISSLDLLLVCVAKDAFWGHFVALSDRAGTLGIQKLKFVVLACVISDRIERGGEATATSMLMMMANWPEFLVSPYVGAALLDALNIKKVRWQCVRSLALTPFFCLSACASENDRQRE